MHEGINREDGRHWCAPDTAPEGEMLVICKCDRIWSYDAPTRTWSQAGTDAVEAPSEPEPLGDEDIDQAYEEPWPGTEERTDEVDV